jgi:hypothetical protein
LCRGHGRLLLFRVDLHERLPCADAIAGFDHDLADETIDLRLDVRRAERLDGRDEFAGLRNRLRLDGDRLHTHGGERTTAAGAARARLLLVATTAASGRSGTEHKKSEEGGTHKFLILPFDA